MKSLESLNQLGFVKTHLKEDYIYIEGIGFYEWTDKRWDKVKDTQLKKELLSLLKGVLHEDEITSYLVEGIFKLAQLELFITQETLNQSQGTKIVFQNGTYDFDKDLFEEDTYYKEEFNTKIINCNYIEGDLTNWNNYLTTTFKDEEECIQLVQEMIGYVLYPSCNFEKSFILYGSGSNGKSVLLNVIQNIIGEYNTSFISMKDLEKSFVRVNLLDKSLNISSELEPSIYSTENFKKIVSGESVEAQFKYKDSFHFKNKAKLLFAMNQLSFIKDVSDGLFRRLSIIPFNNKFTSENRDINLIDKLNTEKDHIAFWAIQGLKRLLLNKKFTFVEIVDELNQEMKENSSPVIRFFNENLEKVDDTGRWIIKSYLYELYTDWCKDNGNKPLNSNNFFKDISREFDLQTMKKTHENKRFNCVCGIKLID
jgi:putative DNA primase/helicase